MTVSSTRLPLESTRTKRLAKTKWFLVILSFTIISHIISTGSLIEHVAFYRFKSQYYWTRNKTLQNIVAEYIQKNAKFSIKPSQINFTEANPNFCWADGKGSFSCLPAFYIAGYPKCSTTDLWRALTQHPNILGSNPKDKISRRKESDFWSVRRDRGAPVLTFKQYLDFYRIAWTRKNAQAGDGTPHTMFMNDQMIESSKNRSSRFSDALLLALKNHEILPVHLVWQYTPRAKFIVLMREPGMRLYSHYHHIHRIKNFKQLKIERRNEHEKSPSAAEFHNLVLKEIDVFRNCSKKHGTIRPCVYDEKVIESSEAAWVPMYKGMYVQSIKDALQLVPWENFIFIRAEDYMANRTENLRQVFKFLNVSYEDKIMKKLNLNQYINQFQVDIGGKKTFSQRISDTERVPMWPITRRILREFYRPFSEELAQLLNDTRYLFDDIDYNITKH